MKINIDECLSKSSIPRIIHQTHSLDMNELSPLFQSQINEVRSQNPTFEHRFYNNPQREEFIKHMYGDDMLLVYQSINPEYGAARSDLFRYLLLYAEGGVYLDVKSGTSIPLESIIFEDDEYLLSNWCYGKCGNLKECNGTCGIENWDWILGTGFGEYQQWWIACRPMHPFMLSVIRKCLANIKSYKYDPCDNTTFGKDGVLHLTGPIAYTQAIFPISEQYPHRFKFANFGGAFLYSFGSTVGNKHADGSHYSRLTSPIVIHN